MEEKRTSDKSSQCVCHRHAIKCENEREVYLHGAGKSSGGEHIVL